MESFDNYEERDHEMLYDDEICELRRYKNLPLQKKYSLMQEQSKELAAKYGTMFLPKEVALANLRKEKINKTAAATNLPVNNETVTLSHNSILEREITKPLQTWTIKADDNESENFILEKINTCSYNLKFAEGNIPENNASQVFNNSQEDQVSFFTESTPVEIPIFKKPKSRTRSKPTKKTPKYDAPAAKDPGNTPNNPSSSTSTSSKILNNYNMQSGINAKNTYMEFLKFANRCKPDDPTNSQQAFTQTDRCRTPSAFHSPRRPSNAQVPLNSNLNYPINIDNNFPGQNQIHPIHRPNPYPKPRYFYDRIQEPPAFYPPFCRPINMCYPPAPFMASPPNIPPPNIPSTYFPRDDYFRYSQLNFQPFPFPVNHHYAFHPFYPVNFPYPPRNY